MRMGGWGVNEEKKTREMGESLSLSEGFRSNEEAECNAINLALHV